MVIEFSLFPVLPKCGETTSEEVSYLSSGEDDDATDPVSPCVYCLVTMVGVNNKVGIILRYTLLR